MCDPSGQNESLAKNLEFEGSCIKIFSMYQKVLKINTTTMDSKICALKFSVYCNLWLQISHPVFVVSAFLFGAPALKRVVNLEI